MSMQISREKALQLLAKTSYQIEPKQKVVIDVFKPEDALGIAHCYYTVYGDKFPMDYVYDPQAIIAVNEGDEHFTAVARTEKGDVVGLIGLFRGGQQSSVYELGQLMVLKDFRGGKALGAKLSSFAVNVLAAQIGAKAIFCEALCNHIISQKIADKLGFISSGVEVEVMPSEAFVAEGEVNSRVSLLMAFKILQDYPQTVFIPDDYRELFQQTYVNLGVQREVVSNGEVPTGMTKCTSSVISGAGIMKIIIDKIGLDLRDKVLHTIEKDKGNNIVHVQLQLTDSCVNWACNELKKEGFFLGGLLPLWFEGDGMFMQRLPEKAHYEEIQIFSDDARNILESIKCDSELS